jgi:hypothetical protein
MDCQHGESCRPKLIGSIFFQVQASQAFCHQRGLFFKGAHSNFSPATAHGKNGSSDIGSRRGQQPKNGFRDFFGLGSTPERNSRRHSLRPVRIAGGGVDVRFHQSRRNGIDSDSITGHLASEANRKRVNGALGHRVVYPFSGAPQLGGARRNVHDGPASTAMTLGHSPHSFASTEQGASHVYSQHPFECSGIDIFQPRKTTGDPSVVDKCYDLAQITLRIFEELDNFLFFRNVGAEGARPAVIPFDLANDIGRCFLIGNKIHGHGITVPSRESRNGRANPAPSTCHDQRSQICAHTRPDFMIGKICRGNSAD